VRALPSARSDATPPPDGASMSDTALRLHVHDQFANGRRFRILNIVDDVTKECLGAIPKTSIRGGGWPAN
jgi:hypothetical protein